MALGLAKLGHRVTVVAADRSESEQVDSIDLPAGVTVVRVPIGRADWIGFGWQAGRYLQSHAGQFDVVHFADVHFAYAFRGPFVASAFQSFRQRLTSHHGRPYHTNWRNYLFRLTYYNLARALMERPAVRRARHLVMPSQSTQREFIDHYGVDPGRTTLLYLGIDLERLADLPPRTEARRQLGFGDSTPIMLYIGFSTPRKGVEYLAQALGAMQTPAQLVMVGKWDANYQARFLAALGEARERAHIAGYVPDSRLPLYLAAADLFVSPTLLEGFGIPLVEAMAAGLPVVTAAGGSAGEVVGDGGLVVPPADSAALAATLDRVLAEPELAEKLREAGVKRACALFDARRAAADLAALYRRILGPAQHAEAD